VRNIPGSFGRTDWVRVKFTETLDGFEAIPVFGKSSLIKTLVDSHGYLEIPEEKEGYLADSWVEVTLWN